MFNNKTILIIDAILLLGVLTSVFLLVGYSQPLAIAPLSSDNVNLLFVIPAEDYVLIDTNSKFDSPKTLFIDETNYFESGRYFIKFFDGNASEIREVFFELDVEVVLKKLDNNNLGFFNIGNSDLKIDTYDTGTLIDSSLAYSGGIDE